jgi:hypothetical protein
MQGAVPVGFAPLGGAWCCFGLRMRLKAVRAMSTEPQRTCPSCGNEFSGAMEFCPVCMLRGALPGDVESGESSFEQAVKATSEQPVQRYEHYAFVTGDDGKPVELGRSAMGVTYKALDINLRCPVTLNAFRSRKFKREGLVLVDAQDRNPHMSNIIPEKTSGVVCEADKLSVTVDRVRSRLANNESRAVAFAYRSS